MPLNSGERSAEEEGIEDFHGPQPVRGEDGKIAKDFFYDLDTFTNVISPVQTNNEKEPVELLHGFGFESSKRNNIHYITDDVLLYAAGSVVVIVNLKGEPKPIYIRSQSDGGVGAVAVHPDREYFAIAERGQNPNIYIREYPSLRVVRILRRGTEQAYSDVAFSSTGTKLASVGAAPDYTLTVWNWREEVTLLRAKAFSQDVFKVRFSPMEDGQLITSGTGHIRFWKMARTFTGLKLQGETGKFGAIEISDVADFAEMPDRTVVTGCESGHLLIWDENLVKCELSRTNGKPCHDGPIECVFLEEKEITGESVSKESESGDEEVPGSRSKLQLVTAGRDGYVRVWDAEVLLSTDLGDNPTLGLDPLQEIRVAPLEPNVKILGMIRGSDHYIMQDVCGSLWKLDIATRDCTKLMTFHSGNLLAIDASPFSPHCVTTGEDGVVQLHYFSPDEINKSIVSTEPFPTAGTCISFAPFTLDNTGRTFVAGFADGVVRALARETDTSGNDLIGLRAAFKPHTSSVNCVQFSSDGRYLATGSSDETVFLLSPRYDYEPLGFVKVHAPVVSLRFDSRMEYLIVCLGDGRIIQLTLPQSNSRAEILEEIQKLEEGQETDIVTYEISSRVMKSLEFDAGGAIRHHLYSKYKKEVMEMLEKKHKEEAVVDDAILDIPTEYNADGEETKGEEGLGEGEPGSPTKISGKELSLAADKYIQDEEWQPPIGEGVLSCLYTTTSVSADRAPVIIALDQSSDLYEFDITQKGRSPALVHSPGRGTSYPDPLRVLPSHSGGTWYMRLTNDRQLLLTGGADGSISIRRANKLEDIVWSSGMHGGVGVIGVAPSFDDSRIISASSSGIAFVLRVTGNPDRPALDAPPLSPLEKEAEDILDTNQYSIEEAKLKSEEDRMLDEAVGKKERTRNAISGIREEYLKILRQNEKAGMGLKLNNEEILIDMTLNSAIKEETDRKLDEARKNAARDGEVASMRLNKLRRRFFDKMAVEHIELYGIEDDVSVATFRCARLDPKTKEAIEEFRQKIDDSDLKNKYVSGTPEEEEQEEEEEEKKKEEETEEAEDRPEDSENTEIEAEEEEEGEERDEEDEEQEERPKSKVEFGETEIEEITPREPTVVAHKSRESAEFAKLVKSASRKSLQIQKDEAQPKTQAEMRRAARERRAKQWEKFMAQRPDESQDDQMDIAVIEHAKRNLGDYKLKMDPDYVVPEDQTVNVEYKRRQMLMLEEFVYHVKMDFNERLLALREFKERVSKSTLSSNQEIKAINKVLGIDEDLIEPLPRLSEYPEKREQYTDEEIEKLRKKKSRKLRQAGHAVSAPTPQTSGGGGGGFGALASAMQEKTEPTTALPALKLGYDSDSDEDVDKPEFFASNVQVEPISDEILLNELERAVPPLNASEMQLREVKAAQTRLEFRKKMLLGKLKQNVAAFDAALQDMKWERVLLESDIVHTNLIRLLLYREMSFLKEFEKQDIALAEKLGAKKAEKNELSSKIASLQLRTQEKFDEVERVREMQQEILSKVLKIAPESSPIHSALMTIFKRKVKRLRRRIGSEESDSSDSESDDGDLDAFDDDEASEVDMEDEVCPSGVTIEEFEAVISLRDERMDTEDVIGNIQRNSNLLKSEMESLTKKEELIENALSRIEGEIQAFNKEKQQKLNALDVVLTLRLDQIQCLVDNRIPEDKSDCLVFSNAGLDKLRHNIHHLEDERSQLRGEAKDMKLRHAQTLKDKRSRLDRIAELEAKAIGVQELKFGQLVDLEALDRVSANRTADNIKQDLLEEEKGRQSEVEKLRKQLRAARNELSDETSNNTEKLQKLAGLQKGQLTLEQSLNRSQGNVVAEYTLSDEKSRAERVKLRNLVAKQQEDIQVYRAELIRLSQKGHVYAPPPTGQ